MSSQISPSSILAITLVLNEKYMSNIHLSLLNFPFSLQPNNHFNHFLGFFLHSKKNHERNRKVNVAPAGHSQPPKQLNLNSSWHRVEGGWKGPIHGGLMDIYIYIWSNYSDLTRPHPKWWFSKGNPLISGKSRLVKYYNLGRCIYIYIYTYIVNTHIYRVIDWWHLTPFFGLQDFCFFYRVKLKMYGVTPELFSLMANMVTHQK